MNATKKLILAMAAAVTLSACAQPQLATRDAPAISDEPVIKTFAERPTGPDAASRAINSDTVALASSEQAVVPVSVQQISVVVPKTLQVSEVNHYLPAADIVWREDPIGDRHAQVRTIFDAALSKGTAAMNGGTPVSLYVQVMRFHALTEKARYTVGGVHSIKFGLAVRDLNTGQLLGEPRVIEADLQAFGGALALAAEAKGQTQKVRITNHLAEVIRQELSEPGGFKNPQLGIIQAMNRF